jgi:uncharacterized phage protein gp47/JayE
VVEKEYTYDAILERMLNQVSNAVDKREGSVIYNALAPAAAELAQAYISIFNIENRTYADSAKKDDLNRRTTERAITRKQATKAIRKGAFNIDIALGSRFNLEDLNYMAIEKITDKQYKMECETEGEIGNYYSGTLIPIDYIDGLESAELLDVIIPGEDAEEDENLRKRYFNTLESESYGGNISDYKEKTNKLDGVGGTKVYPVWNGGGTVKLVIIDSYYNKPSITLVDDVQTAMDPLVNQGKGLGIAPIGHIVTVEGVSEKQVNISSNITLQTGYVWADVLPNIITIINVYFNELNKTWEDNTNLVIRISQIETRVLNVVGVLDIQNTLLNGVAENLVLAENEIATLGDVVKI